MFRRAASLLLSLVFVVASQTSIADGDVDKGKRNFNRCKACHSVKKGRNRIGPSLYCVIGRKAATAPDFKYSKDMKEATAKRPFVWTEDRVFQYIADPKAYIGEIIGKKKANIKMFNKFPKVEFRRDVIAYLASVCKE